MQETERKVLIWDKWERLVQNALEDTVFHDHAVAVDDRRKLWSKGGTKLKTHKWPKDNRAKTRIRIVTVGTVTRWVPVRT